MTAAPEGLNRIIQGLWIGSHLSSMEQLSIRSFLTHGHEYHIYAYNEVDHIPQGAVLKDANEIIPASRIFRYRDFDSYAGFSNYFRYKLLLQKGGWWADLDLICLRPFDFKAEYVFSSEQSPPEQGDGERVNVGAIKSPPGSPLLQYAWDACQSKDPRHLSWGEVGPRLFAEGVRRFRLEPYVQGASVFCPIPWFRWRDAIDPDLSFPPDQAHAIHLWNEMWRREGFDKDEPYDAACLYERLKARYPGPPVARYPARPGCMISPVWSAHPLAHTASPHSSSLPAVTGLVLSKNGAGRLARCLHSITRTGFVEDLVVCIDAKTTDNSFQLAREFTPHVHIVTTDGYIESALEKITSLCAGDFILRIDDDETLDGNWDKTSFQLLAACNHITQIWIPRRWLVHPGESFIASEPWFPDLQLRLFVNDPARIAWPKLVHGQPSISGRSILLYDRWINHYNLLDRPRGERRRICARYEALNPGTDSRKYYLYEDFDYALLPLSTTAIAVANYYGEARRLPSYPLDSLIDFSERGTAAGYTGMGWGQPEAWGTWTVGQRAGLCLPLTAPLGSGAILRATLRPYLNALHPGLGARVIYRGTVIGEWLFDRSGFVTRSLSIPADLISSDPRPSFTFQIPDARSPLEAGESTDARFLGLGFKSLQLKRNSP